MAKANKPRETDPIDLLDIRIRESYDDVPPHFIKPSATRLWWECTDGSNVRVGGLLHAFDEALRDNRYLLELIYQQRNRIGILIDALGRK